MTELTAQPAAQPTFEEMKTFLQNAKFDSVDFNTLKPGETTNELVLYVMENFDAIFANALDLGESLGHVKGIILTRLLIVLLHHKEISET